VLFANPASGTRDTLTIRLSVDGARNWVASRVIEPGPAAYCDLAVTGGGSILCMYETGSIRPYDRLVLARFDLGWVTSRDHE
jgi:sialidase-1